MPPVDSNHGGCLPYLQVEKVEKNFFQVPPLLLYYRIRVIYTIRFLNGLFRPFQTILRQTGQAGPVGTIRVQV